MTQRTTGRSSRALEHGQYPSATAGRALRRAWRAWNGSDSGGKAMAVFLTNVAIAGFFLALQFIRGGTTLLVPTAGPAAVEADGTQHEMRGERRRMHRVR